MATLIDLKNRPTFHIGSEFTLLKALDLYHRVHDGIQKERQSLHAGHYKVDAIDRDTGIGSMTFTHMDSQNQHQHILEGAGGIKILEELTYIPDGYYAWISTTKNGEGIPFQIFEARGHKWTDLGDENAPSDWLIHRHATYASWASEGEPDALFYRLESPEEVATASAQLIHENTPIIGDYLFLHDDSKISGPAVYLQLLDVAGSEGRPYAIAKVMGKISKHDKSPIFPSTKIHPVGTDIDFHKNLHTVGDLGLGDIVAFPLEPDRLWTRSGSQSMVEAFRKDREWKHHG